MSSNGGLNWVNQATVQGNTQFAPGRERAGLMFDSADSLYLLGGMINTANQMTQTVWRSSTLGVQWTQQAPTPWEGRGSGLFFNFRANPNAQIDFEGNPNREILIFTTGWNGVAGGVSGALSNEVWISRDYTRTWSRVRSNWGSGLAPFRARDAANGEVTASGVLVVVGGQADDAQGSEILNESAHSHRQTNQPANQLSAMPTHETNKSFASTHAAFHISSHHIASHHITAATRQALTELFLLGLCDCVCVQRVGVAGRRLQLGSVRGERHLHRPSRPAHVDG